jgi:hypothetical protein
MEPTRTVRVLLLGLALGSLGCSQGREQRYLIGNYQVKTAVAPTLSPPSEGRVELTTDLLRIDTWTGEVDRYVSGMGFEKDGRLTDRWDALGGEHPVPAAK